MEKQIRNKNIQEKHALFKENLNLKNYLKQDVSTTKLRKQNRLMTVNFKDGQNFDVKKHFKFLKENHACFDEFNYKDQKSIKNSYLSREDDKQKAAKKQRSSCPIIEDLQRKPSLKKLDLKVSNIKNNIEPYWAVKEASSKMKNWIKDQLKKV